MRKPLEALSHLNKTGQRVPARHLRSFILWGSAFSSTPSRARAFLKAASRGDALSGEPSRPRAFLTARSDEWEPTLAFVLAAGKRFLKRALSHRSLLQKPFLKHPRTWVRALMHAMGDLGQPLSLKSLSHSTRGHRSQRFIHIAGKRFLGRALSHKSLSPSTLRQGGANSDIHS